MIKKQSFDYLFLDLDGTIMETGPGVSGAVKYAVEKGGARYGIPPERFMADKQQLYIGPSIEHYLTCDVGVTDPELRALFLRLFREYYASTGYKQCRPYPGIIELMADCRAAGYHVYVCTSKLQSAAKKIAVEQGFDAALDGLAGSDQEGLHTEKEDILGLLMKDLGITDPKNCAMIGDRYTDLRGGTLNGTYAIGVRYGYAEEGELEDCAPLFIADTVAALRGFLLE